MVRTRVVQMQHGGPRYVKVNLELTIHASLVVPSLLPRPLFVPDETNEEHVRGEESEKRDSERDSRGYFFDKKKYLRMGYIDSATTHIEGGKQPRELRILSVITPTLRRDVVYTRGDRVPALSHRGTAWP